VPFVIDHMGRVPAKAGLAQDAFRRLLDLARNQAECWVKICGAERISSSGSPFTDAVPFARALIEAAPDRILWGTDWPHPNIAKHMPNDGDLVDLIPLFAPDEATQRRIPGCQSAAPLRLRRSNFRKAAIQSPNSLKLARWEKLRAGMPK
jgi:2-pyrone-4,6-dicarboxylate lactonase